MKTFSYLKQKGLSLVEMMIAMSLGAVVTVGVIQLFTANSETYNLMQGQSRMQESARFALDFIGRSIQQAGYKGCFSKNDEVYTVILPRENIPYELQMFRGVEGFESMPALNWSPVLTDLETSVVAGNEIPTADIMQGTDIITVRAISSVDHQLAADMPTSTEPVDVTIPGTGMELAAGDIAMIHDCEKATIFKVTAVAAGATEATLEHDRDVGTSDNDLDKLAEINTFETDAAVSAIRTSTFYIAPGIGLNNVGDTPLSLWRKFGTDAPTELVEGVEDLQVLYGIDTSNDGTPNQYVPANFVTDYGQVVTIRVSITVNSVDDVGATTAPTHGCIDDGAGGRQDCITGETFDGLVRRTFSQTFQLRNTG